MTEEKPRRRRREMREDGASDGGAQRTRERPSGGGQRTRERGSGGGQRTREDGASGGGQRTRERPSGPQLAKRAREQLAELTGLEPENVTSLERAEDGSWFVTVDLLELARVPDSEDLLGSYEAQIDERGEMLGYRRVRRYPRSQVSDEGGP